MVNELIFIVHTILIALSVLIALRMGSTTLIAFICTQCMLANLFVIKQTTLFGLTATCADAFTVGATLGLNLLQEYYGKAVTRNAIWANFFLLIFYTIVSQLHLLYVPATVDSTQIHFLPLLSLMPRIVIASFSVYLFVQLLDYHLYGLLKHLYQNKYLVLRNYFSIAFCQLIDTILFSFLGLYGLVENIWHIIIISYAIKLISIVIATPFVAVSRKIRTYNTIIDPLDEN